MGEHPRSWHWGWDETNSHEVHSINQIPVLGLLGCSHIPIQRHVVGTFHVCIYIYICICICIYLQICMMHVFKISLSILVKTAFTRETLGPAACSHCNVLLQTKWKVGLWFWQLLCVHTAHAAQVLIDQTYFEGGACRWWRYCRLHLRSRTVVGRIVA